MKYNNLTRRDFLQFSLMGLGTLTLGGFPQRAFSAPANDDHFYLQIFFNGGMDPSYLFDARPLEMTRQKLLQNYIGKEPIQWVGSNGQATRASYLCKDLLSLKEDFSIVNGVLMATDFDGHPQNSDYFLTGNPFGGNSFIPQLNQLSKYAKTSIDGTTSDDFIFSQPANHNSIVPLGGEQGQRLVDSLRKSQRPDMGQSQFEFTRQRLKANAAGEGRFSKANKLFLEAYQNSSNLYDKFKDLEFSQAQNPDAQFVDLIQKLYKQRVARTAILNIQFIQDPDNPQANYFLDTHDSTTAMQQGRIYTLVVQRIKSIIESLKNTTYDDNRSLYDVTTFMIGSEFGRTMRQANLSIDQTGTDHNPLCNSIILGGKGIKGGQVLGQSDYQSHNEQLSSVHLNFDPEKKKFMGKRFDFASMKTINTLPSSFDVENYISMPNVTNSLFSLFGVSKEHHWKAGRFTDVAKPLSGLLK